MHQMRYQNKWSGRISRLRLSEYKFELFFRTYEYEITFKKNVSLSIDIEGFINSSLINFVDFALRGGIPMQDLYTESHLMDQTYNQFHALSL